MIISQKHIYIFRTEFFQEIDACRLSAKIQNLTNVNPQLVISRAHNISFRFQFISPNLGSKLHFVIANWQ